MSQEEYKKQQLEKERSADAEKSQQEESRKNKSGINLKKFAKDASSAISLPSFIEIRDIFFAFAVMMATLKDIVDLGIIGTLLTPLTFVVTIVAMLICGSKNIFGKRKAATLVFGNLLEMLPGLNFLPIETVSTILIYVFILQERKDDRENQLAENSELTA